VTIPDSVTSIRSGTFYRCWSLTSVTIPDSVTSIGDEAFYVCSSLTSVTIPDSVTSIGNKAFSVTNLTEVTIPNPDCVIAGDAFDSSVNITTGLPPEMTTRIVGYVREPFGFGFESQIGNSYVVETTDDLKDWGVIKSYNGTGTLIQFVDERDQFFPQIYYRVKVVE
jgi:hypothetical protein